MSAPLSAPCLVADIGGTHARFALAEPDAQRRPQLQAVAELHTADYPSLLDAARHYLEREGKREVRTAVFAVACPVAGDAIKITNNPWQFSIRELRQELGLETLQLINDFAAIGYAVPRLRREDLQIIGPAPERIAGECRDGHYSVLGPGTGLGVGRLLLRRGEAIVLETEGGHVGFAPATPYEMRILEVLWRERPRVSAERLISGPGLLNLYRAICAVEGRAPEAGTPAQVSEGAAVAGSVCERAVLLFCELLGAFSGDTVLMHGAWDGVYLAGGITPKLLPWIRRGGFRERFERKGRFETLLRRVPTLAITHPQAGLLGAAAHALDVPA